MSERFPYLFIIKVACKLEYLFDKLLQKMSPIGLFMINKYCWSIVCPLPEERWTFRNQEINLES